MDNKTVFLSSELKLNIHIDPIGDITMDNYDFSVSLYCSTRKIITFNKSELKRVDSDNYIVAFDTQDIGTGELKCDIIAYIPDGDFDDGIRIEVVKSNTGITIKNGL